MFLQHACPFMAVYHIHREPARRAYPYYIEVYKTCWGQTKTNICTCLLFCGVLFATNLIIFSRGACLEGSWSSPSMYMYLFFWRFLLSILIFAPSSGMFTSHVPFGGESRGASAICSRDRVGVRPVRANLLHPQAIKQQLLQKLHVSSTAATAAAAVRAFCAGRFGRRSGSHQPVGIGHIRDKQYTSCMGCEAMGCRG